MQVTTRTNTEPRIPRDRWTEHPNWPQQVLLVGSHRNFRRASQACIDHVLAGEPLDQVDALYRYWISGMRSHESYEEHKLYPYLEKRFGLSMDSAKDGHAELHEADTEVRTAFNALRAGAGDEAAGREVLVAALRRHGSVLNAHLDLEEDLIVPTLLEMERDEFEHYLRSPIAQLLGERSPGTQAS